MPDDSPENIPPEDTKALLRRPLDVDSAKVPKGRVFVIPNRCKGCDYCIRFCPMNVLTRSDDINAKGYRYPVVKEGMEDACVHCRFCNLICPEMAIYTEDVSEQDASESENKSVSGNEDDGE